MAGGIGAGDPDQPLSEINVTPLVDVMLVLLVIFIISAPLMAQALRVDLPKVDSAASVDPKVLEVSLEANGTLRLDGHAIDTAMLAEGLAERAKTEPELVLRIQADEAALYGGVAKILATARKVGLRKIAFATQNPKAK